MIAGQRTLYVDSALYHLFLSLFFEWGDGNTRKRGVCVDDMISCSARKCSFIFKWHLEADKSSIYVFAQIVDIDFIAVVETTLTSRGLENTPVKQSYNDI